MHILSVGLNHKTAPVDVRERFAFSDASLADALVALRHTKSVLECVILSTCNRMEMYVVCDQLHTGRYYTTTFLETWFETDREQFADHLYFFEGEAAVRHLFEVTCGLDSMIMGETQILGQVTDAMEAAQKAQTTGTLLNKLFREAITVGKKAHSETEISQNAVSVSYAAVELGKKIFADFTGKTAMILGAGEMGELTAKHLQSNGIGNVLVVNRTAERARALADRIGGEDYPFGQLDEALMQADIVISSTGSEDAVLTKERIDHIMKSRRHRALFLIDIAVPRDIEPAVNETKNVYLYNIDDLEAIVASNREERAREAEKVREFIAAAVAEFAEWVQTLGVVPLITALREKALNIQAETMQSIERRLPDLSERERRVINKQTKSIVNQLLRDPILQIKELAAEPNRDEAIAIFERIFALEELLQDEETEKADQTKEKFLLKMKHVPIRT